MQSSLWLEISTQNGLSPNVIIVQLSPNKILLPHLRHLLPFPTSVTSLSQSDRGIAPLDNQTCFRSHQTFHNFLVHVKTAFHRKHRSCLPDSMPWFPWHQHKTGRPTLGELPIQTKVCPHKWAHLEVHSCRVENGHTLDREDSQVVDWLLYLYMT